MPRQKRCWLFGGLIFGIQVLSTLRTDTEGRALLRCFASAGGLLKERSRLTKPGGLMVRAATGISLGGDWLLPTVATDVETFIGGRTSSYGWVQTSETIYIFVPVREEPTPEVKLEVREEGTLLTFTVDGVKVLDGPLAHQVKPGSEIWMIEDSPDGRAFALAEMDKLITGKEWTTILQPQVSVVSDYLKPVVELPDLDPADEVATVEATLQHLRRQKGRLTSVVGKPAAKGDVLTVDILGFELGPGGTRGSPLDIGAAKGTKLELGGPGFTPEMHEKLAGISIGETRDVEVTLGGSAGRRIICAVSCSNVQELALPELDDKFAQEIKQQEMVRQAGTEQGLDWDEVGAEGFTLAQLKDEIANEVRLTADQQALASRDQQIEALLLRAHQVEADFATVVRDGKSVEQFQLEERLAVILNSVIEREGLQKYLDLESVRRATWDTLGTPKAGEQIAEVGRDPDREYQTTYAKVLRKRQRELVLGWLGERAEVVSAGEGQ